jgi:hypothetical protein
MTHSRYPLIRLFALVLLVAALTAPAASARVITEPPPSAQPTTIVRSNGFDWGDAGIGAGVVGALVLAGFGVSLSTRHRAHAPKASRPTVSAT